MSRTATAANAAPQINARTRRVMASTSDRSAADRQLIHYMASSFSPRNILWSLSETECLHACESCPDFLFRASGGTWPSYHRGRDLLDLWIKLGRPHPLALREHLRDRQWSLAEDRKHVEDLVRWAWACFTTMRRFAKSKSAGNWCRLPKRLLRGTSILKLLHR